MEESPPKVPWPAEEDVEVEEYTSPPPRETKTISMRYVSRGLVGTVREALQPAHVSVWLRPDTVPKRDHPDLQVMDVREPREARKGSPSDPSAPATGHTRDSG